MFTAARIGCRGVSNSRVRYHLRHQVADVHNFHAVCANFELLVLVVCRQGINIVVLAL